MSSLTDQVGRVLAGRYRLVAPVGTGASAHVYAADDVVLSRRVAVKVLHPGLVADQAFLRRFRAEARAAASLNHPNVMRVFDWGEDADGPFLVLEYLGGGSLRELLDAGHLLSPAQAAAVGAQAAHGLAYAHRRGIVHRDIKPANILFDEEAGLRVADFGLARALAEAAWTEPIGAILGTARYASPEQAEGRVVDDRADVYSLALVLFESVTGWVPFSADTTVATLMARLGAHLPNVPELGPLGPILAQAAIPEPLARLDAPSLAVDLEIAARDFEPPAPLPLGGAGGQWPPVERDPTLVANPWLGDRRRAVQGGMGRGARRSAAAGAAAEDAAADPAAGAIAGATATGAAAEAAAAAAMTAGGARASAGPEPATDAPRVPRRLPPAPRLPRQPRQQAPQQPDRPLQPDRRPQPDRPAREEPRTQPGLPPQAPSPSPSPGPTASPRTSSRDLTSGRRRRSGLLVFGTAAIILAVLLVVAGASIFSYRGFVGTGELVPTLSGHDLAAARSLASAADLRLVVTSQRYDGSVGAGDVINQSVQAGSHVPGGTVLDVVLSMGPAPVAVPSLSGDEAAQAEAAITGAHLAYKQGTPVYSETVPAGQVVSWSPQGVEVKPGTTVTFSISRGPHPRVVPALKYDTWSEAQSRLDQLRLVPEEAQVWSTGVPAGEVIDTTPGANATVARGTPITVVVSKGPQYVRVPSGLVGLSARQAAELLEQAGLSVAGTYGVGSTVVATVPGSGTTVQVGTGVTLYTF